MPGKANTGKHYRKVQKIIEGKRVDDGPAPAVVRRLNPGVDLNEIPDARIIDQYAAYLRLSPRTVTRCKGTISEFMHFLNDKKTLDEARRTDIIAFINYLGYDRLHPGPDGQMRHAPLSDSSIKNAVAALKSFYAFLLYTDEDRDYDPMRGIQAPKVKVERGDILTTDEVLALLEAPGTSRDRIQCWLLAFTACRTEEIRSLKWSDVDLEKGLMFILGKGGKYRTLDIHDRLAPELYKWREQQKHEARENPAMARALHSEADRYVLLTRNGKGADPLRGGAMKDFACK